jgi:hypothetical protein
MHMIIKRLIKWLVRAISVFLPEAKAHELQRWRRGREEFWKYNQCQYIFASYGKSGRTWVRVMISRYYQLVYQLPDNILMGFDNFTRLNGDIPKIFFTHDNYLRGYTGNVDSKNDFYGKKTVLLVRNPIDVAVSQFFQWKYRMRPEKKAMKIISGAVAAGCRPRTSMILIHSKCEKRKLAVIAITLMMIKWLN